MKKLLLAAGLLAVLGTANAAPVTIVQQWTVSNATATGLGGANTQLTVEAGTNATWDFDGATLTGTGTYSVGSHLSSNPFAPLIVNDVAVDLVISTGSNSASATSYECIEGTFLAGVGGDGCSGASTFFNPGSAVIDYNVGGDATHAKLVSLPAGWTAGDLRGLTAVAAGGTPPNDWDEITAAGAAFDFNTVLVDGGTTWITNGIGNLADINTCQAAIAATGGYGAPGGANCNGITTPGLPDLRGLVAIQVVPVPAAVWLFGSALGLLGWVRRRIA